MGRRIVQPDRSGSQKLSDLRLDHRINQIELNDLIGQFGFPGFHRAAGNKDHRNIQAQEAISIPGVILSQLEMQTMASAQ